MYAVVVKVAISDQEAAESHLRETVVPGVSQAPGFVTGYWTRKDESGVGMVVFESEDAAKAMSEGSRRWFPSGHPRERRGVRSRSARLTYRLNCGYDQGDALEAAGLRE